MKGFRLPDLEEFPFLAALYDMANQQVENMEIEEIEELIGHEFDEEDLEHYAEEAVELIVQGALADVE